MISDYEAIDNMSCLSFDPFNGVMLDNSPLKDYPTAVLFDILDVFEQIGNTASADIVRLVLEKRAPEEKEFEDELYYREI